MAASSSLLLCRTRREILKCVPASLLLGPSFLSSLAEATAIPSMDFPRRPLDRLAVTSYPFRTLIMSPTNRAWKAGAAGMDLKDFPAFVADKFGVHNINPLLDHFSSVDRSYIDEFRKALEKAHSHIVDLALSGKRFYAADAAIRQEAVEYGKKCIDIASQVGSPSVRQHVAGSDAEKPDVALAANGLGEMAAYGERKGIVVNLENDSAVSEDPFFLVAVIEKVKSPYLRALPDFGNSLIGHDEKYNHDAVEAMMRHVWNMCHVKDEVQGHDGKVYTVDLRPMFELAKKASYGGYFSMEFDTANGEPVAGTKRLVDETLKYLS